MAELPHYSTILLATDGSAFAEQAARHAVALARQTGAALWAIYVVDTHLAFRLGVYQQEARKELREEGERALAAVKQLAESAGVPVHIELCEGRPGPAIVEQAQRHGADVIVVGSHGQGALTDLVVGSVSGYVLHHARVPVFVIRPAG